MFDQQWFCRNADNDNGDDSAQNNLQCSFIHNISLGQRHGSADPTPCGGYAGPACWAAILIIHIAGSCATRIISQQILVTRLLVNCGEAISVSATVMTVNADNIMKRIHQSILLRMRRQGRTSRTPYSASIADCFHVML